MKPDYRVRVEVGTHVYDVTSTDPPGVGVALPLTFGYRIPESVDFFPAQPDPLTGSFGLVADSLSDVGDLALGDPVRIEVFVPSDAATAWQTVRGSVTQLAAEPARKFLTVFYSDPVILLADRPVGLVDWPEENVEERLARIAAEAGFVLDDVLGTAYVGLLPARDLNPTDALSAIRETLRDAADKDISTFPGSTVYGRPVYAFDQAANTLVVRVWPRRVFSFPAQLGGDGTLHRLPGVDGALDGCAVEVSGAWSRLRADRRDYVIVDDLPYGSGVGVPYLRSTRFVYKDIGPNPTAAAVDALGNALLPTDALAEEWRADTLRHRSYLDPDPVADWFGAPDGIGTGDLMPWLGITPVIVEPIAPTLTPDGRTWLAGTLAGARFTLPPGGRFYIDVTLRPDLFEWVPGTPPGNAATYADLDPALTYADLDPDLTYRDLRLLGA